MGVLEFEAPEVAVSGESSGLHLVANRAQMTLRAFGIEQLRDQRLRLERRVPAARHQLWPVGGHPMQLQRLQAHDDLGTHERVSLKRS